ncbi:MAG: hypothetical protein NW201_09305 [Gemmatimonadales bacterium]|nr:hypothetical protein [Gemmatimonadales bacterium]
MPAFRAFLVLILVVLGAYTLVVVARHGLGLLPVFFGDMATLTWAGQFNLDFLCMLLLAGLWVAWRHGFSPAGLALGGLAVALGAMFLAGYLLVHVARTRGDVRALLLGPGRSG